MAVIGNPTPIIRPWEGEYAADNGWCVDFDWSNVASVDRPITFGITTGPGARGRARAERLASATRAGKAFGPADIVADIGGRTYVRADCLTMGRHLNADLERWGF